MSGGQDEASERINVGDLPYWLAGPIKRLEARVARLEEAKQQPATDQPAKRREWWVYRHRVKGHVVALNEKGVHFDSDWEEIRVIAAPSEAEIEAAVHFGAYNPPWAGTKDAIRTAIRKLLGGGE